MSPNSVKSYKKENRQGVSKLGQEGGYERLGHWSTQKIHSRSHMPDLVYVKPNRRHCYVNVDVSEKQLSVSSHEPKVGKRDLQTTLRSRQRGFLLFCQKVKLVCACMHARGGGFIKHLNVLAVFCL